MSGTSTQLAPLQLGRLPTKFTAAMEKNRDPNTKTATTSNVRSNDEAEGHSSDASGSPRTANTCYTFLSLPAELRNGIYELALIEVPMIPERSILAYTTRPSYERPQKEPALTMTCRQIRRETLKIFYERNIFEFRCYTVEPAPRVEALPVAVNMMSTIDISPYSDIRFRLDVSKGLASYKLDTMTGNEVHPIRTTVITKQFPGSLTPARKYLDESISRDGESAALTKDMFGTLLEIMLGRPVRSFRQIMASQRAEKESSFNLSLQP